MMTQNRIFRLSVRMMLAVICVMTANSCRHLPEAMDVILDTDANNELDDQHAIAYMLLNQETFNVLGITTNVTIGGGIQAQVDEVDRVCRLMGPYGSDIKILYGATGLFENIRDSIQTDGFDGQEAVDFIIEQALAHSPENKLTVIPVGKLTNIALALSKEPSISDRMRIMWLGSNYPEGGEHNLICDPASANYVIASGTEFSMMVCRYGEPSGTWAVRINVDSVRTWFAGQGPQVSEPVTGRHGGEFHCFGDYSVDLFEHIRLGNDGGRSLYDMAGVAVVKNPEWCESLEVPACVFDGNVWSPLPDAAHNIKILENFNSEAIISDFRSALCGK